MQYKYARRLCIQDMEKRGIVKMPLSALYGDEEIKRNTF